MTDNEIIQALKCCQSSVASCEECPMYVEGVICHGYELNKKALDLITSQQAEIERLKKYNTEVAYKHYNDGIKEFADRVKMAFYYEFDELIPSIMADTIDSLVKEMVGDTE